jgi:hypothetical protein
VGGWDVLDRGAGSVRAWVSIAWVRAAASAPGMRESSVWP